MTKRLLTAFSGRITGIAPRITAVTIAIMTVSALLVGALVFTTTARLLIAEEERNLAESAEAIGTRLKRDMQDLRTTVRLLAGTPPINGIIRAQKNNGWDAQGNSSEEVWAQRLATIFAVTLSSNPVLTQARYIGIADGGRELVRVDFRDGAVVRTTGDELQQKGHRYYVQEATRLKSGQVYLSDVDLNRERGRIMEPHQPTVRAAIPIYDGDRLFGLVVVNADFNGMVEEIRQRLPTPGTRLYLTNSEGDFLVHPDPSKTFGFDLGRRYRIQDDKQFAAGHDRETAVEWFGGDRDINRFAEVAYDPLRPDRHIGVLLSAPYDEVVRGAAGLHRHLLALSLALILVAAMVTVVFVQRQVRPLRALTLAIERGGLDSAGDFSVPPTANRETRILAKALAQMSQRVEEHTAALQEANREMESFSYSVSHDLRGPLRAINGFSAVLQEEFGDRLGQEGQGLLARVQQSSLKMSQLIDGLLILSRIQRQEMAPSVVDLSAAALEIIDELRAAEPEREVECVIEPKLVVTGDPALLRALLQNLLGNAWKYTRLRTHARIELGRRLEAARELFYVSDNGAGFEPEYAHKLFEPFSRLHDEKQYKGTGIGLATVRRIVQRHGGTVWAEGEVDRGATVFFTLGRISRPAG